ncbi:MAG: DUF3306 domain-containing protein [Burkholderiales bacterium]|nr:DUF3306 domain-containing protein [Burkholderiales bacterium]
MPADSFLSRWSKRKQESRAGTADAAAKPAGDAALTRSALVAPADAAETQTPTQTTTQTPTPTPTPTQTGPVSATAPVAQVAPDRATAATSTGEAKTELPPVDSLTPESDFRPFMKPDVDPAVRNQAMKSLFRDPHFNVMDMMDVYVDDYSKPDPIPADMLRQMTQSRMLKLFDDLPDEAKAEAEAGSPANAPAHAEAPAEPPSHPDNLSATSPATGVAGPLGQKVSDTTNCPIPGPESENETQQGAD